MPGLLAATPGPLLDALLACITAQARAQDRALAVHHGAFEQMPEAPGLVSRLAVDPYPTAGSIAALARQGGLALALVDQPEACVSAFCAQGLDRLAALRQAVVSAARIGGLRDAGMPVATGDDMEAVARLLAHLGVDAPDPLPPPPPPQPLPSEPDCGLLVAPIFAYAATGQRAPLSWPCSILFDGDTPGQPAPEVIELAGPARVLVYGPYFALPPGRWSARARLRFSPAAAGAAFRIEIHGSAMYGACSFAVARDGAYGADFPVVAPPPYEPLEVRLLLERGVIGGRASLTDIAFTPQD